MHRPAQLQIVERTADASDALTVFVVCAQAMLDPMTPEPLRRTYESRLVGQLTTLKALGAFDLFSIRDPALAALVNDELATVSG
ncbi:hypothetical protein FHW69_001287 [Luteibacter sp. Sphag1AF]|uniref:hypothetical protein n=1 Tax=Luteibacter sp. Sphag1AF TaxID=2587031 RepID=UPI00160C558F|nr:hypothetical protein [Luteibacter sp. Sphag1AF]MBB3226697.1 hypothetical protein [Luteibacter sp. Sphag1AF]